MILLYYLTDLNSTFQLQNNLNFFANKSTQLSQSLHEKCFDALQGKTQEQRENIQRGSMDPITSKFLLGRVDEQNPTLFTAALWSIYQRQSSD